MLVDTHCHIHEADYPDPDGALERAENAGVEMFCVGTNVESSKRAAALAQTESRVKAIVGVHPHDSSDGIDGIYDILKTKTDEIIGIGEIGLDYFYTHSPRGQQIQALEQQLQWAIDFKMPVSFHVREAFDDFWPVFDNFHGIQGVLHSFTDTRVNLDAGFERNLYVAVNGISTFTKDKAQQQLFASIPLEKLLLETDSPFLTPVPMRGKVNEPAFVMHVAQAHADYRGISFESIATATTLNAQRLFLHNA